MASSATFTQLDPAVRAAFSPIVLTDLLHGRLGFDGVVISDDLGNARAVADVPPGSARSGSSRRAAPWCSPWTPPSSRR
ncbi:MAG: Beta-N-acetylhexosaminidase [Blastococcus sp.]|nr:Beta-N-acetylhexosaminidase [Blastococcus sp.]